MSKKILQVTTVSPTLGFLTEHIKLLLKQGNEVQVATNIIQEINNDLKRQNIKINQVDFQRNPLSTKNLKAHQQIKNLQKREKYEIVHVHTPIASFLTRLALRNEKNIKIIYTAHGFHFYKGAPLKNWFIFGTAEKLAARWTDVILTMNEEDYNFASNKLKNKRLSNVFKIGGVGIGIDEYSNKNHKNLNLKKELNIKEDDFVISIIGELNTNKNQIQIIKATEQLIKVYSNIKLLIIGIGNLYTIYKKYIKDNNLEDNVFLLGYRQDVPEILEITDVIALMSYREGLPKNLMEAMCNKKPIVCTNIRGNRDLVKHGENGFLVDIGDVNSTLKYISILYDDEVLRKCMGDKSFDYVQDFSEENVLKSLENIYGDLI